MHRVLVMAAAVGALVIASSATAHAAFTPNHTEYHVLTFPVREPVSYWNDFAGPRDHHGNDLMGKRLYHLLAADSGTIEWTRTDPTRRSGNMLSLKANDGWTYWYIHINNDTPGTDDGKNPKEYTAPSAVVDQ